jgi:APA family basic amino acid/polyamine antiporter
MGVAGTPEADRDTQGASDQPKRGIDPMMLLFFVAGDIIGAGIYARVGAVAGEVGGTAWVSFLTAMLRAALTGLSYAELVSKYPGAAGAVLYVSKAFRNPFFTFMVAFTVVASGLASASAIARAFGGNYLSVLVNLPTVLVSILFINAINLINLRGITESINLNVA